MSAVTQGLRQIKKDAHREEKHLEDHRGILYQPALRDSIFSFSWVNDPKDIMSPYQGYNN